MAETTTTMTPVVDTTAPSTTTTLPPPDPPDVEPSLPQKGAAAPLWDDEEYGEPEFAATLAGLAGAGAEWVTLIPTWYQIEPTSSVIFAETPGRTSTDEALVTAITQAKELGLRVALKPHVDLVEGGSRISIEPAIEEEWFSSYTEMILGYAEIAEAEGVDQLIVGTELGGTSGNTSAWEAVISETRAVFSGPISYAANHDEYDDIEFWEALDFVGVDAYFPLADEPTTDIDTLTAAWDAIGEDLSEVAAVHNRTVVFTEVGYPSQEGATVEPFNPFISDAVSEEEQAAALQAMMDSVASEDWFGGFHWWMWFVEDTAEEAALGYMPEGKEAGSILEGYWAEG